MIVRAPVTLRERRQPHSLQSETETAPIQPHPTQPHAKPRRLTKTLKWAGLAATVLVAAVWGGSGSWAVGYRGKAGSADLLGGGVFVTVYGGNVSSSARDMLCISVYADLTCAGFRFSRLKQSIRQTWLPVYGRRLAHTFYSPPHRDFYCPLWIPLLVLAIPTVILWRRDRRYPVGHCRGCGYDLTGNVTGVCSECGQRTEQSEAEVSS